MSNKSDTPNEPSRHMDVIGTLRQIKVLRSPHLLPRTISEIRRGKYETPEIDIGLANLRPGDRIMEMGSGAGVVGAIIAKHIGNLKIRSFEANPNLIPHIRELYEYNGVDGTISVSNNVVVTDADAPEYMDFVIARNFLGSSLSQFKDNTDNETVAVPSLQYDDVTRDFPHNVIIMDIEGAELDFLQGAKLDHVELVMLELHPKVYGEQGRRQLYDAMKKKGFSLDRATSSKLVVTFKKKARMKLKPDLSQITFRYDLDHQKPQSDSILTVENAVLAKSENSEGYQIAASVFDADGDRVPQAISWISHRMAATQPRPYPREGKIKHLPGTWLFGGRFHPHFGHFLCETLARLWALDFVEQPLDGVIFFPMNNDDAERAEAWFQRLSEILNVTVNYKICDQFYRVDRLIIPPQGSGIGRLMGSSPEMRGFITKHLKRDFEPLDCKKLYISRSGQFGRDGRVYLGEDRLEGCLRDEGYTIFHPEEHSWGEQLRYYLSADHILGADGSALHLANFTGRADLNLGIIRRRNTWDASQLAQQARLFGVENAHVFDHMGRLWAHGGSRGAAFTLITEIHFASLCEELKQRGYISDRANWDDLTTAELKAKLDHLAQDSGRDVRRVSTDTEGLAEFPRCAEEGAPQVFFGD